MQTLIWFLVWGAFFFLMMRFGCGAHIMGHAHRHSHDGGTLDTPLSPGGARWIPPAKDIDPVCGMTIETAGAKSAVYDGHVYYFCSQECRQKFESSPQSHTGGAANSGHTMEHSHEHSH